MESGFWAIFLISRGYTFSDELSLKIIVFAFLIFSMSFNEAFTEISVISLRCV